jgi:SH3-like domain-containing protein
MVSHLITLVGLVACTAGPAVQPSASTGATAAGRTTRAPLAVSPPSPSPQVVATVAAVLPAVREAAAAVPIAVVANTNGQGVWMRREPAGEPVKIWPDGAPMAIIGAARSVDGRDWQNVRAADGQAGWVAADYLRAADVGAVLASVGLPAPGGLTLVTPSAAPVQAASASAGTAPRTAALSATPALPILASPSPTPVQAH